MLVYRRLSFQPNWMSRKYFYCTLCRRNILIWPFDYLMLVKISIVFWNITQLLNASQAISWMRLYSLTEEEILRLEVSVDNPPGVEIIKGAHHARNVEPGGVVIKPSWNDKNNAIRTKHNYFNDNCFGFQTIIRTMTKFDVLNLEPKILNTCHKCRTFFMNSGCRQNVIHAVMRMSRFHVTSVQRSPKNDSVVLRNLI